VVNDPRNPLAKYQKAVVLAAEERYEEALAELEELKALAPKEATVFFLMGACRSRENPTSLRLEGPGKLPTRLGLTSGQGHSLHRGVLFAAHQLAFALGVCPPWQSDSLASPEPQGERPK
jgi:hypothetical protein